ncbi:VanW family protein [Desulfosporosinus acididurans]|uniref:VanW family protein n=1 Tax=Desulfosporosinus acididurans TaxID=476652 RepID=UPI00064B511A|nr:VanW family protein [Desulfosporosinus acididurans]
MNYKRIERPRQRSSIRLFWGKLVFTFRRYVHWYLSRTTKFAYKCSPSPLQYIIAKHQTPLYRQLRDVDMWLQENKVVNLKLATTKLHGLILKPGETFSLWRLVGKPTKRKGYKEGMVLSNGTFQAGIGGGLCQLSNLIYWMTLHTSLTVTERWRHTHDVFPDVNRTQPFASGATIVYNYVDLQVRNNTLDDYQLLVWLDKTHLHGEWRSKRTCEKRYEVYESHHQINQEWWGGYTRNNIIRRKVYDGKENLINDEFITENRAIMMYEPMLQE